MRRISTIKAAMSVGAVFAVWHAMWVTLVGMGWAAEVLDFILRLHFLKIDIQLAPYSGVIASSLIAVTSIVGALLGAIFAIVWNWLTMATATEAETKGRKAAAAG